MMLLPPPANSDLIHATLAGVVVAATTVLGITHTINGQEVSAVFAVVVGYAAGRSGTLPG